MSQQWYVSKGGRRLGPFTSSQIKKLADSGQLKPEDLIWKEGLEEWIAASSVKGLFPDAGAPRTPPPLPKTAPAETCPPNDNEPIRDTRHETEQHSTVAPFGRHRQRLGILITAGLGAGATFLPWAHAPILGTMYGSAGDGWITLVLFIPALVLALRGDPRIPVRGGKRLGLAIPAAFAAILGVWKIISFKTAMSNAGDGNPLARGMSQAFQIGFGLYLLVAAGTAVILAAWLLDTSSEGEKAQSANKSRTIRDILNDALLPLIEHVRRYPKRWLVLILVLASCAAGAVLSSQRVDGSASSDEWRRADVTPGSPASEYPHGEVFSYGNITFEQTKNGHVEARGEIRNETEYRYAFAMFDVVIYDANGNAIGEYSRAFKDISGHETRLLWALFFKTDINEIKDCRVSLNLTL